MGRRTTSRITTTGCRGAGGTMDDDRSGNGHLRAEAFATTVDRHQRQLHVYLTGLLGSADAAFDVVQETFYDAWRAAQKGSPPFCADTTDDDVRRRLFRVATNNALSMLRHKRLIRFESLDLAAELPSPMPPFDELLVEGDALRAAMAQ